MKPKQSLLLLSEDRSMHLLHHILLDHDKEHNRWHSNKNFRLSMETKLDMSRPTYVRLLRKLVEKGILLHQVGRKGTYHLNRDMIEFGI